MASAETADDMALVVEMPHENPVESNGDAWLLSTGNIYSVEPFEHKSDAHTGRGLVVGVKLLVATFFCLLWNATGVVIIMTCSRHYMLNSKPKDVTKVLTLILAAVPFLCVGSILLWIVMVEWCKHLRGIKFRTVVTSHLTEKVAGNSKAEVLVLKPPLSTAGV